MEGWLDVGEALNSASSQGTSFQITHTDKLQETMDNISLSIHRERDTHTHTHMYVHVYIYIYMCVCVYL